MMQKSTTFTRILRVKKVPLSLRYAKKYVFSFHTGDTNPYFFILLYSYYTKNNLF
jgi:hypothetical protein